MGRPPETAQRQEQRQGHERRPFHPSLHLNYHCNPRTSTATIAPHLRHHLPLSRTALYPRNPLRPQPPPPHPHHPPHPTIINTIVPYPHHRLHSRTNHRRLRRRNPQIGPVHGHRGPRREQGLGRGSRGVGRTGSRGQKEG